MNIMKISPILNINNNTRISPVNNSLTFRGWNCFDDTVDFSPKAKETLEIQKLRARFEKDFDAFKNDKNKFEFETYKKRIMDGLIKGCFNSNTGKIDESAVDFVDKYLFEKQGKIKTLSVEDKVNFGCNIQYLLEYMKDETGNINQKNLDFVSRVIESRRYFQNPFEYGFIALSKNDDGIVEQKTADFMLSALVHATNTTNGELHDIARAYMIIPDRAQDVFDYLYSIHHDYSSALKYLEKDSVILGNCDIFPEKNFDFIKALYNNERYNWAYNLDELELLRNTDGTLPDDVINKALEMSQHKNCTPEAFYELYSFCEDENKKCNNKLFNQYKTIYSETRYDSKFIKTGMIFHTLKKYDERYSLSFNEKFKLLNDLKKISQEVPRIKTSGLFIDFYKMTDEMNVIILGEFQAEKIDENDRINFVKNVLFNPDFDETVKNNIEQIKTLNLKEPMDNSDLAQAIDEIFKGIPELKQTIGKKQYGVHAYSLDIHTLLVLANAINDPKYQTLSNSDKMVLKLSALLHDIAKEENINDINHPRKSAIMSSSILDRYIKDENLKKRTLNLIKTHEWLKEYSTSADKKQQAQLTAFQFRRDNDFELAKMLTRADILSINDSIYKTFIPNLENIEPVENYHKYIQSTGCAIFSDFPYKKGYRIINMHKIEDDEDMGQYGFIKGKKKSEMQFLVHMIDNKKIERDIDKAQILTNKANEAAFSLSLITPKYKNTFAQRNCGFIVDVSNPDIISTYRENQNSGSKKGVNEVLYILLSSKRKDFKNYFLKKLDIENLNDDDYIEFYNNVLASKASLYAFKDEYCKIGEHTVPTSKVIEAIEDYQDSLIRNSSYNETVALNPKIKGVIVKADRILQIPYELVNFAKENKLPIVLI